MGVSKQYSENETPDVYVEVPEMRGQTRESATAALEELNLHYTIRGTGQTIVDQLPAPDEQLEEDSIVILYTEDRAEDDMVTVPDLTGRSVSDAKYILNNRGLNFEISGAGHSEAYNAFAISQNTASGSKVLPGTVIGVEFRQQTND
jgi:stage V sporulation protein D (sporulation-specific penicillin-binding protein)